MTIAEQLKLLGVTVIENHFFVEWFRRPRSKRRRIINKWKKAAGSHRPRKDFILSGNTLIGHPAELRKPYEEKGKHSCSVAQGSARPCAFIMPNAGLSSAHFSMEKLDRLYESAEDLGLLTIKYSCPVVNPLSCHVETCNQ